MKWESSREREKIQRNLERKSLLNIQETKKRGKQENPV